MKLRLVVSALLLLFAAACSTVRVDRKPAFDVSKVKHVFVEHRLNDNHGIDLLIVSELKALGRDPSVGPLTMMPEDADAIVSYDDDWTFDFTTHMTVLEIRLRDARKDTLLATGHFSQTGVTRDSPAAIVHQVMTSMFAAKSGGP